LNQIPPAVITLVLHHLSFSVFAPGGRKNGKRKSGTFLPIVVRFRAASAKTNNRTMGKYHAAGILSLTKGRQIPA
jgi:hypothetical protein